MTCFRNFTVPLWEIFGGNLLMLVTIIFYIAWWTASFRPNGDGKTAIAGFFITAALFTGIAAIVIIFIGINSLPRPGKGFPVLYIALGAAAFFIIFLAVTVISFQRVVTSELLLITFWAALECSTITVLQASGRLSVGQALSLAALVMVATGVGIVCYILHYRIDESSRFRNGLIPLITDAGVVTVILVVFTFFRNDTT